MVDDGYGYGSGTVSASYAAGPVSSTGTGGSSAAISPNLVGATITATYWDANVADDSDANMPDGKTTNELQSGAPYAGIYADRNVNVDGQTGNDARGISARGCSIRYSSSAG